MRKIHFKIIFIVLAGIVIIYLLLMIPLPESNKHIQLANEKPFVWNRDKLWNHLENSFQKSRKMSDEKLEVKYSLLSSKLDSIYDIISNNDFYINDVIIENIRSIFFELAPIIAVKEEYIDKYINRYINIKLIVKQQSQKWDLESQITRDKIYELLYGMRAAVEEVILQTKAENVNSLFKLRNEISSTPSAKLLDMDIHSGDVLLSRGGAEVSALISRGNDYPGNFSHVALAYVDSLNDLYFIESHIEKGVAIANAEQYLKDKKLRIEVLRLRSDLPELIIDPLIPDKAAEYSLESSKQRHIPYDFAMNYFDTTKLFCSEVASLAYSKFGIKLWEPVSTISSSGITEWLNDFGVENFVTTMPSDLEYDPKLSIVYEWFDKKTLLKDHIDNAVIDVMFEIADKGVKLKTNYFMLPIVRILKAWCYINNLFGIECIIPEGMSSTQALKNQYFEEMHQEIKSRTEKKIGQFIEKNGYLPPYWQLVNLARESITE